MVEGKGFKICSERNREQLCTVALFDKHPSPLSVVLADCRPLCWSSPTSTLATIRTRLCSRWAPHTLPQQANSTVLYCVPSSCAMHHKTVLYTIFLRFAPRYCTAMTGGGPAKKGDNPKWNPVTVSLYRCVTVHPCTVLYSIVQYCCLFCVLGDFSRRELLQWAPCSKG